MFEKTIKLNEEQLMIILNFLGFEPRSTIANLRSKYQTPGNVLSVKSGRYYVTTETDGITFHIELLYDVVKETTGLNLKPQIKGEFGQIYSLTKKILFAK